MSQGIISAFGGHLIDRAVVGQEREELVSRAVRLRRWRLNRREASDLDLIACGALSPLRGFMGRDDYDAVVDEMHLPDGLPWTIPVSLAVPREEARAVREGEEIALESPEGLLVAVIEVESRFDWDRQAEAHKVYGTEEARHPGVAYLQRHPGEVLVGGPVRALAMARSPEFGEHEMSPAGVREAFATRGWSRVVGFQTRNPVHRAIEMHGRQERFRGIRFDVRVPELVKPIFVDPDQVQQVLQNLVLNAEQAMPGGGTIALAFSERPGGRVEFSVSDQGAGIPPDIRPRIFEPFFSTKKGKSAGLGLAICLGIVQQHGGTIELESEVDRGTTFRVLLPGVYRAEGEVRDGQAHPGDR